MHEQNVSQRSRNRQGRKDLPTKRRSGKLGPLAARRLLFEPLEDRRMLAIFAPIIFADSSSPGSGSLRADLAAAAANSDASNTIMLGSETYTLTNSVGGELQLNSSAKTLFIVGDGPNSTIIHGSGSDRVFEIDNETVIFENLAITGGIVERDTSGSANGLDIGGGGILNLGGTVTLANVAVTGNIVVTDEGALGGGIFNGSEDNGSAITMTGTMTLNHVLVSQNTASSSSLAGGGGIFNNGTMRINDSVIDGNKALSTGQELATGGGIDLTQGEFSAPFVFSMSDSTVEGNTAQGGAGGSGSGSTQMNGGPAEGGGLSLSGDSSTLIGDTISGNQAIGGAGGLGTSVNPPSSGGNGGFGEGGGVFDASAEAPSLYANDTIANNSAAGGTAGAGGSPNVPDGQPGSAAGGGLALAALTQLTNDTITGNSAFCGAATTLPGVVNTGAFAVGGGVALESDLTVNPLQQNPPPQPTVPSDGGGVTYLPPPPETDDPVNDFNNYSDDNSNDTDPTDGSDDGDSGDSLAAAGGIASSSGAFSANTGAGTNAGGSAAHGASSSAGSAPPEGIASPAAMSVGSKLSEAAFARGSGTDLSGDSTSFAIEHAAATAFPLSVLIPGAILTVNENSALPISGIVISEPSLTGNVQLASSVAHGTLTVDTGVTGGITAGQVTGNGTPSLTITAPIAAINATLNAPGGLFYNPNFGFTGTDTLTLNANDLGNNSLGTPQTARVMTGIQVGAATQSLVTVANTIIAGNTVVANATSVGGVPTSTSGDPDVCDTLAETGDHDLIGILDSQDLKTNANFTTANGNIVGNTMFPVGAGLGPPENNGGLTATEAEISPGGPTVGHGDPAAATAAGLTTDQRGPGFNRFTASSVDIGAYQLNDHVSTFLGVFASASSPNVGQSVTFTAVVWPQIGAVGTPTGAVTFSDGGTVLRTVELQVIGGSDEATFSTSSLTAGDHQITAAYSGDTNYGSSSNSIAEAVVDPALRVTTVTLTPSSAPVAVGQNVTFTAEVAAAVGASGTPTGTVEFFDGSVLLGSGTLGAVGGIEEATLSTTSLAAGSHLITAIYEGNANFDSGTSTTVAETVTNSALAATTTAVTSSVASAVAGASVTFVAEVAVTGNPAGTPTGTVTFLNDGTVLGTAILVASGGVDEAVLSTTSVAAGSQSITAVYSGDSSFDASTSSPFGQSVEPGVTVALASGANTTNLGQVVTFTAVVAAAAGESGTPTGSVTFTDGGTVLGSGNLGVVNGMDEATLTTSSLAAGAHFIAAEYGGGTSSGSSGSQTLAMPSIAAAAAASNTTFGTNESQTVAESIDDTTLAGTTVALVSSATTAIVGDTVTFTATIAHAGASTSQPTGNVTFMDGGTVLGTAALGVASGGDQATFTTTTLSIGTHSITAVYSGDANFNPSTSAELGQTINAETIRTGTTVTLMPSSITPSVGQTLTLTAVVSPSGSESGVPTGLVAFSDGGNVLGGAALSVVNGVDQATLEVTLPASGVLSLSAIYVGDTNFNSSTSSPLTESTNDPALANANVTLAATSNPASFGDSVTFTATAAPTGSATSEPTGTVAFMDGTTLLGTETLSVGSGGNQAAFTTTTLAAGSHSITAVYSGDTDFNPSTSNAVAEVINSTASAPTVTTVAPNTGPISGGTSVTITGTNLTGATTVDFGTLAAASFTVNTAGTQIVATSPAAGAGPMDVTVVTASGTSATSSSDTFTYTILGELPPVLAPVANQPAQVGTPVTVPLSATDPHNFTLSYQLDPSDLSTGATVNPTTGVFTFTPTSAQAGQNIRFVVIVSDEQTRPLSDAQVFSITVAAPPSITMPPAQIIGEGAPLTFDTADNTAITISDPSAATSDEQLTLSVGSGTLTLGSTTGVSFLAGGNGQSNIKVTGTLTNLNNALQGLTYTPNPGVTVPDKLQVSYVDMSTTLTASGTTNITIQAPSINVLSTQVTGENTPLVFPTTGAAALGVTDLGAGSGDEQLMLSVGSGSLTLGSTTSVSFLAGGNGQSNITVTGTLASLNAALEGLKYTPETGSTNQDSLTINYLESSSTASAGSQPTATEKIGITIEAPSIAQIPGQSVNVNSALPPLQVQATTAPDNTLTYQLQVLQQPAGNNNSASAQIDPNSGVITWTPDTPGTYVFLALVTSNGTPPVADTAQFTVTVATNSQQASSQASVLVPAMTPAIAATAQATNNALASDATSTNQPPTIVKIPQQNINVGQQLQFTVSATDPQNTQLTYQLLHVEQQPSVANNSGNAVIDPNTGVFTWKPNTAGTYVFLISATNSTTPPLADTAEATVVVAPAPAPAVTSLTPISGPTAGGTSVTITGTNLTGVTAVNFGSLPGTIVPGSSTNTQIVATSPAAGAGPVNVTVVTAGGTSAISSTDQFTYVAAPAVTSLTPISGPTAGGTSVTITGTNLTGVTAVNFGSLPGTIVPGSSTNTQIVATSPAAGAGPVNVTVVTAGGTSAISSTDQFTYVAAPAVTSLTPISGPTAGGTSVTITGTNLTGVTAVNFGSLPGTIVPGSSTNTQIVATSPAAGAGPVNVTVVTAGGTSAISSTDQFTYVAAPAVTSLTPISGPTAGGTSVTITGTNLTGVTAVNFGSLPGTIVPGSSTNTQIVATSPAAGAGPVNVTVVTAGGTSAISSTDQFTYVAATNTASLSGVVFANFNGDSDLAATDPRLAGVILTLTGTDSQNNPVGPVNVKTANDGSYQFTSLPAGTYTIEKLQPQDLIDNSAAAGSVNGTTVGSSQNDDVIANIEIPSGDAGTGYDFSEGWIITKLISINLFLNSTPPVPQLLNTFVEQSYAGISLPANIPVGIASPADPPLESSHVNITSRAAGYVATAVTEPSTSVPAALPIGTAQVTPKIVAASTPAAVSVAASAAEGNTLSVAPTISDSDVDSLARQSAALPVPMSTKTHLVSSIVASSATVVDTSGAPASDAANAGPTGTAGVSVKMTTAVQPATASSAVASNSTTAALASIVPSTQVMMAPAAPVKELPAQAMDSSASQTASATEETLKVDGVVSGLSQHAGSTIAGQMATSSNGPSTSGPMPDASEMGEPQSTWDKGAVLLASVASSRMVLSDPKQEIVGPVSRQVQGLEGKASDSPTLLSRELVDTVLAEQATWMPTNYISNKSSSTLDSP